MSQTLSSLSLVPNAGSCRDSRSVFKGKQGQPGSAGRRRQGIEKGDEYSLLQAPLCRQAITAPRIDYICIRRELNRNGEVEFQIHIWVRGLAVAM